MTTTDSPGLAPHPADAVLFRLMDPAADQIAAFHELRDLAPVHLSEGLGCFVSGYEAACAVLTGEAFGTADAEWFDANQPEWRDHPLLFHVFSSLVGAKAADHARLRRLVSRAFNIRRIEQLRPRIGALTERALNAMAERAERGGPADIPTQLALPVAIGTIAILVGVPDEDIEPFAEWVRKCSIVFEPFMDPAALAEADLAYTALHDYFTTLVAARRREPRDDLVSALIAVRDDADDDRLTEQELIDLLSLIFGAGFETTAGTVGNAIVTLVENPGELARFKHLMTTAPERVGPATDELARLGGSIRLTRRLALTDTEVGGVPIPAGTNVVVLISAANRDPAHFPDPDRLDLLRSDARPLSYGLGIHYCLGAALARIEMEEILTRLLHRFPTPHLATTPTPAPGLALVRHASIPVTLG